MYAAGIALVRDVLQHQAILLCHKEVCERFKAERSAGCEEAMLELRGQPLICTLIPIVGAF